MACQDYALPRLGTRQSSDQDDCTAETGVYVMVMWACYHRAGEPGGRICWWRQRQRWACAPWAVTGLFPLTLDLMQTFHVRLACSKLTAGEVGGSGRGAKRSKSVTRFAALKTLPPVSGCIHVQLTRLSHCIFFRAHTARIRSPLTDQAPPALVNPRLSPRRRPRLHYSAHMALMSLRTKPAARALQGGR
jgi:hypothetical protein